MKQRRHDRAHTLEMPRAELAIQDTRQPRNIDPSRALRAIRIDLGHVRHEHKIASSLSEHALVLRGRAWIVSKILVRPELHRVHEDTGYETIAVTSGRLDEADVTGVEVTHGGNEGDTPPFTAPTAHVLADRSNLRNGIHRRSLLNPATSQGVVVEATALHSLDRREQLVVIGLIVDGIDRGRVDNEQRRGLVLVKESCV